jgi:hypothetical protein
VIADAFFTDPDRFTVGFHAPASPPANLGDLGPGDSGLGSWPVRAGSAELKAEVSLMEDFFKILAAGPAFFVSRWLLMRFAGITGSDTGIRPFGYVTAMVVTVGLWLTLASAIGAIARTSKTKKS